MAGDHGGIGPPSNGTAGPVGTGAGGRTSKRPQNHSDRTYNSCRDHRQENDVAVLSIYDGQAFLGVVRPRDRARAFDAYTANGEAIGAFTRPEIAARAIYAVHLQRQQQVAA